MSLQLAGLSILRGLVAAHDALFVRASSHLSHPAMQKLKRGISIVSDIATAGIVAMSSPCTSGFIYSLERQPRSIRDSTGKRQSGAFAVQRSEAHDRT